MEALVRWKNCLGRDSRGNELARQAIVVKWNYQGRDDGGNVQVMTKLREESLSLGTTDILD